MALDHGCMRERMRRQMRWVYAGPMATTIRVPEATRARAASIAAETGLSLGAVVDRALDAYELEQFWRETRTALSRWRPPADDWGDRAQRDGLVDE